jgi:hypothetical protein
MTPGEDGVRNLAEEIHARRLGLAGEEANLAPGGHATYVRAKKHREEDRARINGMVIALTFVLGRPLDIPAAEAFIAEVTAGRKGRTPSGQR